MFGEREQQKKKKKLLKTTRILKNYLINECKNGMKMCTFSSGV